MIENFKQLFIICDTLYVLNFSLISLSTASTSTYYKSTFYFTWEGIFFFFFLIIFQSLEEWEFQI